MIPTNSSYYCKRKVEKRKKKKKKKFGKFLKIIYLWTHTFTYTDVAITTTV